MQFSGETCCRRWRLLNIQRIKPRWGRERERERERKKQKINAKPLKPEAFTGKHVGVGSPLHWIPRKFTGGELNRAYRHRKENIFPWCARSTRDKVTLFPCRATFNPGLESATPPFSSLSLSFHRVLPTSPGGVSLQIYRARRRALERERKLI